MAVPPEATDASSRVGELVGGLVGFLSILAMIGNAFRPKKEESSATRTVTETVTIENEAPWLRSLQGIEASCRRAADGIDVLVGMERERKAEDERRQVKAEARIEAQEEDTRRRLNDRLLQIEAVEALERRRRERAVE